MKRDGRREITPETRVAALLDDYPELETTLVDLAPPFAKLRNPLLRKTVAKVTTLRQAAKVGGVSLGVLINRLREVAGVEGEPVESADEADEAARPQWLREDRIGQRFDARPVIEAGERPMEKITSLLKRLEGVEILELTTPFVPAPIIDMATEQGFASWQEQLAPELVKTFFTRRNDV